MHHSLFFREQRQFVNFARALIRLPAPGEGPLEYLLPEAHWQELGRPAQDLEAFLMALSQATGIYFFPSREWVPRLVRYLKLLGVARLLEAGCGRGYLTAALAPLAEAAGLTFKAIDRGDGEFQTELPVHPRVELGDLFTAIWEFKPQAVLYAWPPPGQSLAEICQVPFLHYLLVVGEAGGGVTGAREDWQRLPHRISPALSRYARGRTGQNRQVTTIFSGAGSGKGPGRDQGGKWYG